MDYGEFYNSNDTYLDRVDDRLAMVADLIGEAAPAHVLDVGCGGGVLLRELHRRYPEIALSGTDVLPNKSAAWNHVVSDITKRLEFADESFDVVVLGEIIEHVPDPDFLLTEARRVLAPNGTLIVTTPNLVSWMNRALVLTGTQPLFTETSTEMNLGRRVSALGQAGKVQGHLKIFTHKSLAEIMDLTGFDVVDQRGTTFFFPFPLSLVDRVASRFPSLASGLVFVARKRELVDDGGAVDLRSSAAALAERRADSLA